MIDDKAYALLGAGIAMIAVLGVGIGQGLQGAKSLESIARNPEILGKIRSQYILAVAITETGSLYCFIIAILLIFVAQ